MAQTDEVEIALRVKIDQLKAELEKIPGISAKSANAMAKSYSREYKKMERDGEKAAASAKRSAGKTTEAWKGSAERVSSLMGGTFGDISDSIFDLGERFTDISAGMGGMAGAATLVAGGTIAAGFAIGFAGKATKEWLDTMPAILASLKEWEGLEPVSVEEHMALDAYRQSSDDLDGVLARLQVTVGAGVAPAMTDAMHAMIGLVEVSGQLNDMAEGLDVSFEGWARNMMGNSPATWALREAYDALVVAGKEVADQTVKTTGAMDKQLNTIRQTNEEATAMLIALGMMDDDEPIIHRAKVASAAAKAELAAKEELHSARKREQDSLRAANREAIKQADERAMTIDALPMRSARAAQEAWDAEVAGLEEHYLLLEQIDRDYQEEKTRSIKEAALEVSASAMSAIEEAATQQTDAIAADVAARKEQFKAAMAALDVDRQRVEAQQASGKLSAFMAKEQLDAIDAEEKAEKQKNRQVRREQNAQYKSAWKAQKMAQRGMVGMNAATAYMGLLAAFAPLGLGAPAAAAAIVGPATHLQLKAISSQEMPKYATGGMVPNGSNPGDHVPVMAAGGEGVLTERGVAGVGGPQGLDALNRGTGGSGGGLAAVYIGERLVGAAVVQAIRSDPEVHRQLARQSGQTMGKARYGGRG